MEFVDAGNLWKKASPCLYSIDFSFYKQVIYLEFIIIIHLKTIFCLNFFLEFWMQIEWKKGPALKDQRMNTSCKIEPFPCRVRTVHFMVCW